MNERLLEIDKVFNRLDEFKKHWFIERAYLLGRADYYASEAWLCIRPKYGYDVIKFEIMKSGDYFYYMEAIDDAIKYLTPYRVFVLNVKTFFCYIKSML